MTSDAAPAPTRDQLPSPRWGPDDVLIPADGRPWVSFAQPTDPEALAYLMLDLGLLTAWETPDGKRGLAPGPCPPTSEALSEGLRNLHCRLAESVGTEAA